MNDWPRVVVGPLLKIQKLGTENQAAGNKSGTHLSHRTVMGAVSTRDAFNREFYHPAGGDNSVCPLTDTYHE